MPADAKLGRSPHSLIASPEACKYKARVEMISMVVDSLASLHLLLLQGTILEDGKWAVLV